jgi:hypothetical protein
MQIDFFTDNEQRAPIAGKYLFTDYYAQIMQGQYIENDFSRYQVNALIWNEDRSILNAFLWKFPNPL